MSYADAETLLASWLGETLTIKTWADPKLPPRWDFDAPIAHIQRAPGGGDAELTLDAAIVDVDVYANVADNARTVAELIRKAIRVTLPSFTTPEGVFVKSTGTVMAPVWLPDSAVYKRSATYSLVLHTSNL